MRCLGTTDSIWVWAGLLGPTVRAQSRTMVTILLTASTTSASLTLPRIPLAPHCPFLSRETPTPLGVGGRWVEDGAQRVVVSECVPAGEYQFQ